MQQVLFHIPFLNIPIYGFGVMLFAAFVICDLISSWRARKEGVDPLHVHDLAVWIFISGIIGARITYMIQYRQPIRQFFAIWQGGLVFYGSFIGGVIGFSLAYYFILRKHRLPVLKMLDICAPSVAMGLCLGRIGCLLNGCCFGNVACTECPAIHFPLSAPPRFAYVRAGYQTAAGFTLLDRHEDDPRAVVGAIETGSPTEQAGVETGDRIVALNGLQNDIIVDVPGDPATLARLADQLKLQGRSDADVPGLLRIRFADPDSYRKDIKQVREQAQAMGLHIGIRDVFVDLLDANWPRGEKDLQLTVVRAGAAEPIALPAFRPLTLGLHPTQIYESISTSLIFLLVILFMPFRRHYGEALALFMVCYSVHRFLNEMLRNDTDPVFLNMTLSQNGSIIMLLAGIALLQWAQRSEPLAPSASEGA